MVCICTIKHNLGIFAHMTAYRNLNSNGYKRYYHHLSDENPIELLYQTHKDPKHSLYDMHYGVEIGIVCTGNIDRHYRHWQTRLKPGDIWLCGIWEPHGMSLSQTPCEVLVFHVFPEFLFKSSQKGFNWLYPFTIPPEQRPQISDKKRKETIRIAEKLKDIISYSDPEKILWTKVLLFETLLTAYENLQIDNSNYKKFDTSFYRIQPALQIVFENKHFITVEEAARACCMSRNGFAKLFDIFMGISFADFALRFRLNGVTSQLIHTNDCIETIAKDWGFTGFSHLHRHFVDHYKLTPGKYRKKSQQMGIEL